MGVKQLPKILVYSSLYFIVLCNKVVSVKIN